MDMSVIVCTRNRDDGLKKLLQSLAEQVLPSPVEWQVIIIDNNPMKSIYQWAQVFSFDQLNVRIIREERQGKSFALNTGISAALGDIIAFTDDDCLVSSDWVFSMYREFVRNCRIDGIGGRVLLHDQKAMPVAIRTGEERTEVKAELFDPKRIPILGCNMAFRREVIQRIGLFDIRMGPGSKANAVAEDVDYLYRLLKKRMKIIYSPSVIVFHDHGRKNPESVKEVNRRYLTGRGAFYCKHILNGDRKVLKMAYWEISPMFKSWLKSFIAGSELSSNSDLRALLKGASYMIHNRVKLSATEMLD